jgi:hypothetical protein
MEIIMSGGRASRDKGNRAERAIVKFLQAQSFAAEPVPLSGSGGGSYLGDLTMPVIGIDRVIEVKCRANGFKQLYDWLIDRDILIVRADRSEPLVVLPLKLAGRDRDEGGCAMNAHVKVSQPATVSPLAVTDPHIRKQLQLCGLRFAINGAHRFKHEATMIGIALKSGAITSDEVDAKLEEMDALDLVYPELMGCGE